MCALSDISEKSGEKRESLSVSTCEFAYKKNFPPRSPFHFHPTHIPHTTYHITTTSPALQTTIYCQSDFPQIYIPYIRLLVTASVIVSGSRQLKNIRRHAFLPAKGDFTPCKPPAPAPAPRRSPYPIKSQARSSSHYHLPPARSTKISRYCTLELSPSPSSQLQLPIPATATRSSSRHHPRGSTQLLLQLQHHLLAPTASTPSTIIWI